MSKPGVMKWAVSLILLAAFGAASPAVAQNWGNQFSPGQARDAREQGRIVPLRDIFRMLENRYGGYQLGAELFSRNGGGSEYRIDWMSGEGRKMKIVVDAQSGRVLSARGG